MASSTADVGCAAVLIGWAAGSEFGGAAADGAEFGFLAAPTDVAPICFQAAG